MTTKNAKIKKHNCLFVTLTTQSLTEKKMDNNEMQFLSNLSIFSLVQSKNG